MRLGSVLLFVALGCQKHEAAQLTPPASAAPVASTPPAPSAAPPPKLGVLVDLLFEKGQLYSCDQIEREQSKIDTMAARMREELAKEKKTDEVVIDGKTCEQATSQRLWHARCVRPEVTTYYYAAKSVRGSDAHFKECLERKGEWKTNETTEAEADALQRELASPEREALRRRAVEALTK